MLKKLSDDEGSDLYLAAGAAPSAKFSGVLTALKDEPMSSEEIKAVSYTHLTLPTKA